MENNTIPDSRITSPAPNYSGRSPRHARLNGPFSWCAVRPQHLHIDLGKNYKVTSIATQGGRMDTGDKWVKQYKIAFYAGATHVMYTESGLEKVRNLKVYGKPHIFISLSYILQVTIIIFHMHCDTIQVVSGLFFRFSGI